MIESAPAVVSRGSHNNGGLFGGIGYLGEKVGLGFLSGLEGIWDFAAGGLADLFGADEWAESQFANDWVNYNHADEWFDPGKGWQVAGDVAGGIGTSLPSLAAATAVTIATGGTATPLAIGLVSGSVAGVSAAGNATKEAYRETGKLTGKEYGYGALSGLVEGSLEGVTNVAGKAGKAIGKSLLKAAGKESAESAAKAVTKSGFKSIGKELAKSFAGEAVEEGISEFVSPHLKWATYDKNAERATLGEIGYSALVGGLSGALMSGGSIGFGAAVNTTQNFFAGKKAEEAGDTSKILDTAKVFANYESEGETGIEAYASAAQLYGQITDSLMKNNGIENVDELMSRAKSGELKMNTKERMILGKLQRVNTIGKIYPAVEKSAMNLVLNADASAQAFEGFGMTDANGNKITYTAEQITEGMDADLIEKVKSGAFSKEEYSAFLKELRAAIKTNAALATVSVADATGRILIDTKKFEAAARDGAARMTPDTLAQYKAKASKAQQEAFARDLGYNTLEEFYSDSFEGVQSKLEEYLYYNGEEIAARTMAMSEIKRTPADNVRSAPTEFDSNTEDGVYSITENGEEFAIHKKGNTFRLYSYAAGDVSKPMTAGGLNEHLERARESSLARENIGKSANLSENENSAENVTETEDRAENVREGAKDAAENVTETAENVAEATEDKYSDIGIGIWARENVGGYGELSEPAKRIVRDTIRQARALGKADLDIKLIATVAARSGLNIVYDASIEGDGLYRGNTIYVNPELSVERTCEVLLGHEMFHKLFASGGKRAMKLYNQARKLVSDSEAQEIRERYKARDKKSDQDAELRRILSGEQESPVLKSTRDAAEQKKNDARNAIYEEEVAAHGAEAVFNSAEAWEYIFSEEPSFKQKVLGFFTKSAQDYSSIKELSAQSRKFLREYRKLFKELEARNRGNNALSRALETTPGKEKTVTSMNDENMQVTERMALVGKTKDGRRCYVSGFDESLSMDARVKLFKERIATIFNLGAVELKTDVKKIRILGDKFTAQKNIYGDLANTPAEQEAKINSLYDLADILATSTYDPNLTSPESSYVNPSIKPKNAAHKNVKYWYKFKNNIVFDGVPYTVTFNIRDKGKEQYQYLIEFKEDKTPGLSNTVYENLLRTDQASYINSIPQNQKKSTASGKKISNGRHALPKTDKKAAKQSMSTVADPDKIEVSRGKLEQMRANYKGDKVFYKKDVVAALKGIDALVKLPADMREDIANRLWRGYNIRLNSQGFDLFTETMYYKLHAEILQESGFDMSHEELAVMDDQIYAALGKIVESGKTSARANVKAEVEAEFKRESIEAELKEYKKIVSDKYKARNDSREATRKREQVRRQIGRINRLLFNPTKEKNIPYAIQSIIADAMRAEDISTVDMVQLDEVQTELDKLRKKDDSTEPSEDIVKKIIALEAKRDRLEARTFNMKKTIDALNEAYAKFESADDPLAKRVFDSTVLEKLAEYTKIIGDTPIKRMNLGQLNALIDYYALLRKKIDNANQLFHDIKSMKVDDAGRSMIREFDEVHVPKILSQKSGQAAFRDNSLIWKSLKPLHFFEILGSDTLNQAFLNLRAGEDVWARDGVEAGEYFKTIADKYGFRSWDMDARETVEIGGRKVQLTLGQKMSLYAYSRRNASHEHLKNGGFIFSPDATYKGKNEEGKGLKLERLVADSERYTVDEITIMKMASTLGLTDEQIGFVEDMQKYLSKNLADKGNEVSLQLHGIKLFNDEFYLPMVVASEYLDSQTGKTGDPKIKNKGMTKKLTPNAKNPLVLMDFMDVWKRHVNDMALYHGMTLPMEDMNALLNYRNSFGLDADVVDGKANADINKYASVKEVMRARYGSVPVQYIEQLLRDLNGGAVSAAPSQTLDKLISKYKKSAVAMSLSVVAQQPSSIARAFSMINPKYFAAFPKLNKSGERWEQVKKYAPVAIIKEIGGFDTGTGQTLGAYITANEYKGVKEKLKGFFKDKDYRESAYGFLASKADELTWIQIFEACRREQADKHPELKIDSDELLTLAGERFTEVVTKTQVYDSTLSRSEFMRSKDTGWKMATAFMAEPTTIASEVILAAVQFSRGQKKKLGAVLGSILVASIMNAFLSSFVYAARDDDEDKTYFEKYVTSFISKNLEQMNPMTWFPFLKDIYSICQGYDIERTDMAVFADLYNAISGLTSENKTWGEKIYDFSGTFASLFGIPLRNVLRDARGLVNVVRGVVSGEKATAAGLGYAVKEGFDGLIISKIIDNDITNGDEMYKAIIKGDTKHYNRVRGRYKDDSSADTALRTALRDNDPRIEAAAKAKLEGDAKTYQSIITEIANEGKFERRFIVRAVTSEYLAIKRDLEDAGYTVFVGEQMYTLSEEQKVALEQTREKLAKDAAQITNAKGFSLLNAEQKDLAMDYAEDLIEDVAESLVLGADNGNTVLLCEAIGINKIAVVRALTKGFESDIGRDGKAVAGSKRAKVVAAINKLDLTPAEKLLLICAQGYTIKDSDIPGVSAARANQLLLRYILSLKISKEKRARLAELCGFAVQNGKIMLSK